MKYNILIGIILVVFSLPIFFLITPIIGSTEIGITNNLLLKYSFNSIIIAIGTGCISFFFAMIPANLITFYDFPGKRIVKYIMIFPLALPIYINALSYNYFIESIPWLKNIIYYLLPFESGKRWSNLFCQIFIMSISLYPYLYIICIPKLQMIKSYVVIALTLNKSLLESIKTVAMPLCKPAIITGIALITMEVISDFGSAHLFGISTFTTGIYRAWFLLENYSLAAKLLLLLLIIVMGVFIIEKKNCDKKNLSNSSHIDKVSYDYKPIIKGYKGIIAFLFCLTMPALGFFIPLLPMIKILITNKIVIDIGIIKSIINTIVIAAASAILIILLTLKLSYISRHQKKLLQPIRLLTTGYAIPGIVVSFGLLIFLGKFSDMLNKISEILIGHNPRIVMIGSIWALIYTYTFRFIGIAIGTIDNALEKIPIEYDWITDIIGKNRFVAFFTIHIPLIWKSIGVAFMLLFIDISKELSATLIIRPFNFDTITTKLFDMIDEEQFISAVPLAILTVAISLVSVIYITREIYRNRKHNTNN